MTLHVNAFGMIFVFDKATRLILTCLRSNELAKFVTSAMLDTTTWQVGDWATKSISREMINSGWYTMEKGPAFVEAPLEKVTDTVKEKRIQANSLANGYWVLLEQASIQGAAYDSLSDMSVDDLHIYNQDKQEYVKRFSEAANMELSQAVKHLEFLAETLTAAYFRKQALIWKHSRTLRKVKTHSEFVAWRDNLLVETVGLGDV